MRKCPVIISFIFVAVALIGQFGSLEGYSPVGSGQIKEELLDGETFDFIVAGGGTAGCAVAARLAESGEHSVLLIEAGGLPHPNLSIPALAVGQFGNPNVVKVYLGVRQEGAALDHNGTIPFIRGNMLGGSSELNAQVLNRGSPQDYDNWAKLTGDESWSYENMLKYFKKYESYAGDAPSSNQRGLNGPITISRQSYAPGKDEWLAAGREKGFNILEPNAPQMIGFSPIDFTRKRGQRSSSYSGYIAPILGNPGGKRNLIILLNTEVNRVIFEGSRAVGVEFIITSKKVKGHAKAKKEVVVCAGAVDSPALLMRSGIGPESVLTGANIQPVKYLTVGSNLHDQPLTSLVVAFTANKSVAFDEDAELTPESWDIFLKSGDGPYSLSFGSSAQSFLASSQLPMEDKLGNWYDLQLIPFLSNVRSGVWDRDSAQKELREGEIAVAWPVWAVRPRSRGSVTLNPKDIDSAPVIDGQYLTNPYDLRVLVDGLKICADICENTTAFRRVGCRVIGDRLPACSQHKYRSDEYWGCYARRKSTTGLHLIGSCRMGRGPEDPQAVVDSKLRVIGIEGLRVADASIMPTSNANPMAPVYAIAEKAAEMILLQN